MATSNKKKDSFTSTTWIISKIIIIEPHAIILFRVGDEHVIGTDVNFIVLVPVLFKKISEATVCKYSID